MEQGTFKNGWLLDATSLLALLLPIAQLAFVYLPSSLKGIYLQQEAFLGVSLVTLLMCYVSIVAYKSRPWFVFVLPFRRKKMAEYEEAQRKIYEASSAINFVNGEMASLTKITKFIKGLNTAHPRRPFVVDADNRIGVFITVLFANVLLFLILGLNSSTGWLATLQSVNYFFIIIFSVLVLVIYRDTTNNNKRYNEELRLSTSRAIDLAIRNNCFTPQPQVKFISTHGGEGMANYVVQVEFEGDNYEICTNPNASKLIYCYKLSKMSNESDV